MHGFTTTVVLSLPVAVTIRVGAEGGPIKVVEAKAIAPVVSVDGIHDLLEEHLPGTVSSIYWAAKHSASDD
jgi:hypothetical protein